MPPTPCATWTSSTAALLREALAASLVKRHQDRPLFDELFDRCFAHARRPSGGGDPARRRGTRLRARHGWPRVHPAGA